MTEPTNAERTVEGYRLAQADMWRSWESMRRQRDAAIAERDVLNVALAQALDGAQNALDVATSAKEIAEAALRLLDEVSA
jgi:hypothetical protein